MKDDLRKGHAEINLSVLITIRFPVLLKNGQTGKVEAETAYTLLGLRSSAPVPKDGLMKRLEHQNIARAACVWSSARVKQYQRSVISSVIMCTSSQPYAVEFSRIVRHDCAMAFKGHGKYRPHEVDMNTHADTVLSFLFGNSPVDERRGCKVL